MRKTGRHAHHAMPREERFKVDVSNVMDLDGYIAENNHNLSLEQIAARWAAPAQLFVIQKEGE
jgi:hypothetical protein